MAVEYTKDQQAEEIKRQWNVLLWEFDLNKIELLQLPLIYQRDTRRRRLQVLTLNCENRLLLYLFPIVLANCIGPRKISISYGRSIGRLFFSVDPIQLMSLFLMQNRN